ncbi:MAG TPA: RNA methyltransferase [Thermomicrobiales bacterium]|nr:RNA methyltransferase [Thermomicrobiales bacterium]
MKGKKSNPIVNTKDTNRSLELIARLAGRVERERIGLYFAEGVRALARAVEQKHDIRSVMYVPSLLNHAFARRLVERLQGAGVETHAVAIDVFQRISRLEEPQWVGVVVRQRWTPLGAAVPDRGLCWVGLESIRSPGNLGTILRTCEAVGAAGLIALGTGVDPFDPSAVRASMGSIFTTTPVRANASELTLWATSVGAQLVAMSPKADVDFRRFRYRSPLVVLAGGERPGLSVPLFGRCDAAVSIPMVDKTDSLNMAIATGVLLYEVLGQRLAEGKAGG